MSEQYYRLLNVGETLQEGDQFYNGGSWSNTTAPGGTVEKYDGPYRRPITSPVWPEPRLIKTDPPELGSTVLMYATGGIRWIGGRYAEDDGNNPNLTHWLPMPPAPPPVKADWEVAFEKAKIPHFGAKYPDGQSWNSKELFRAGWEARGRG